MGRFDEDVYVKFALVMQKLALHGQMSQKPFKILKKRYHKQG
jgi:hypothetical protein